VPNPILLFLRKFLLFRKQDLNLMLKKNKSNHLILSSLKKGKPSDHKNFSTKKKNKFGAH
jgi:hypothetical protein